jgi:hypothetical protein
MIIDRDLLVVHLGENMRVTKRSNMMNTKRAQRGRKMPLDIRVLFVYHYSVAEDSAHEAYSVGPDGNAPGFHIISFDG